MGGEKKVWHRHPNYGMRAIIGVGRRRWAVGRGQWIVTTE